jgi:undecaprenyl-diphosphatase
MLSGLSQIDREILFFLNHLGASGVLRDVIIRLLATGLMYALLGIVLYLFRRKPGGRQVLFLALTSAFVAVVVGKALNQIVVRDRPFVAFPHDVHHVGLIVRPDSFPSIHAVAALGLVGGVLFGRYRRWGALMLLLALAMVAARVAAGVNWPSDVVGGGLIGLGVAAALVKIQGRYWPRLGLGNEWYAHSNGEGSSEGKSARNRP